VAKVTRVRSAGSPHPSAVLPRILVQCVEITGDVEDVLKGEYLGRAIRFFYYMYSRRNSADLGPPEYVPVAGVRRMFFLTREGDIIRSIGDIRDYTLRIPSGYHDRRSLEDLSFGQRVAAVLLTPGEGYDSHSFVVRMGEAQYVSDQVASSAYTDMLLRRLQSGRDQELSREATELLADRASRERRAPSPRRQ
jgi:hypothetical protein